MYKPKFMNITEGENEVEIRIDGDIVDNDLATMYDFFEAEHAPSPKSFRGMLDENKGKEIKVVINSYGGDVFAAASIYTALMNYQNKVTVYVESIAASAASVIAMAGKKVVMSPVAALMIHNPSTYAEGDHNEMEKSLNALKAIKETIITAYEKKTNLSREKISALMENETWMDAYKAKELGFIDEIDSAKLSEGMVSNIVANNRIIYNQIKKPIFDKKEESKDPESQKETKEPEGKNVLKAKAEDKKENEISAEEAERIIADFNFVSNS